MFSSVNPGPGARVFGPSRRRSHLIRTRGQVLLYLMYAVRFHYPQHPRLGGSDYTIQEVAWLPSQLGA